MAAQRKTTPRNRALCLALEAIDAAPRYGGADERKALLEEVLDQHELDDVRKPGRQSKKSVDVPLRASDVLTSERYNEVLLQFCKAERVSVADVHEQGSSAFTVATLKRIGFRGGQDTVTGPGTRARDRKKVTLSVGTRRTDKQEANSSKRKREVIDLDDF